MFFALQRTFFKQAPQLRLHNTTLIDTKNAFETWDTVSSALDSEQWSCSSHHVLQRVSSRTPLHPLRDAAPDVVPYLLTSQDLPYANLTFQVSPTELL